jgi:acyl carrier protein
MNNIKEEMARILAEWLFKDFGLLIEAPKEDDIAKTLEEYEEG